MKANPGTGANAKTTAQHLKVQQWSGSSILALQVRRTLVRNVPSNGVPSYMYAAEGAVRNVSWPKQLDYIESRSTLVKHLKKVPEYPPKSY